MRRAAAAEGGFTMIIVIGVLVILSAVSASAYSAATRDVHPAAHTDEAKRAYAAAEAGLGWYQSQLALNPSYALNCTSLDPKGGPTYTWRQVDSGDATNKAQFAVEALPTSGTQCVPNNEGSMVDPTNGTMRIRVTGRARPDAGNDRAPRRSVIATFRRSGFLDYLYLTDLETFDPPLQVFAASLVNVQTSPDFDTWAQAHCDGYWEQRKGWIWKGLKKSGANWVNDIPRPCTELQFGPSDVVNGPFHTNDSVFICGNPTFGASLTDTVEVSDGIEPVRDAANDPRVASNYWGCASTFVDPRTGNPPHPPMQTGRPVVQMPPWNAALSTFATPSGGYTGKTTIAFASNGTMTVTNPNINGGAPQSGIPQPANGVIYVGGSACFQPLNPDQNEASSCGDLRVSGQYTQSMTLYAQGDIIVTGSLTKTGSNDPVLGLIADNYVRVTHPTSNGTSGPFFFNGVCSSFTPASSPNITIQAAILALKHSFMVDNWRCPPPSGGQGTLTVIGAIAQKYRGPVGAPATGAGYSKTYTYDPRFKYRSPPRFLDPLAAPWKLARTTEQSPSPVQ